MENLGALVKLEEIVNSLKAKTEEKDKSDLIISVLAVIGIVAAIAGIAYAVYSFMTPDYLDDFDDDFEDDFDDEELLKTSGKQAESKA